MCINPHIFDKSNRQTLHVSPSPAPPKVKHSSRRSAPTYAPPETEKTDSDDLSLLGTLLTLDLLCG